MKRTPKLSKTLFTPNEKNTHVSYLFPLLCRPLCKLPTRVKISKLQIVINIFLIHFNTFKFFSRRTLGFSFFFTSNPFSHKLHELRIFVTPRRVPVTNCTRTINSSFKTNNAKVFLSWKEREIERESKEIVIELSDIAVVLALN